MMDDKLCIHPKVMDCRPVMRYASVGVLVDDDIPKRLAKLCRDTGYNRSEILRLVIDAILEANGC
ncbi:hypothetical protein LCGC14_2620240 [marine sediment metagenome]|uniref:Ribbon-helix-helix protein CopG domain-containing protein n=1 Tax=marine sediment metagenome TaxID=412755 RepID=A0A0F9CE98_9ZZZZ